QDRFYAEKFKSDLEEIYKNKIYIIFEAPNYKVRIGDFIDRKSAEEMRKKLSKKGHSTAWIIRSKIEAIDN
ncbi:MAG: SPOR domain-containing protein, partial [Candidatus Neomarinimicrobiota bacterium]|nr:SPOR domain-containing protein [Candidatus Neomarinimicrobiota bacterium]